MRFLLAWAVFYAFTNAFALGEAPAGINRVAVIGAGIGGSTAAYFLGQELGNSTGIDVYDAKEVGGRTQALEIDGRIIEMGASIVHEQNKYFRDLSDAMGLKTVRPGKGNKETQFSIYDGNCFVFHQSEWTVVTLYRMVRRYGMAYFWFRRAPSLLLQKFKGIYSVQSQGQAFRSPVELLKAVGLLDWTQEDMRSAVQEVIGSSLAAMRFAKEFIGAINHINYNQNNSINALAGMVSMLPTIDSRLFQIEGGNYRLAEKLLDAAAAKLVLKTSITAVEKTPSAFYLHAEGKRAGPYAAVILAAPLEQSNLSMIGFEMPFIPKRQYQTTVTTIVRGKLRAAYFGVPETPDGEYIMMAEGAKNVPFSVIAPITDYSANQTRLYKVFSAEAMDDKLVGELFERASVIARHSWQAYPRFSPPEEFAPFELAEGLYYNNALETGASAMEIAAVAGKNNALLVASYLSAKRQTTKGTHQGEIEL